MPLVPWLRTQTWRAKELRGSAMANKYLSRAPSPFCSHPEPTCVSLMQPAQRHQCMANWALGWDREGCTESVCVLWLSSQSSTLVLGAARLTKRKQRESGGSACLLWAWRVEQGAKVALAFWPNFRSVALSDEAVTLGLWKMGGST